ncbi:FAD-dependent oxidoreductase [Sulfobacillus harzensis]|uniref:FAD-dependent oxidoreductase n=1 Tax=Sulfobacillus harzensis TaxID=2729629 RepID=A0A7Y0L6Y1_9FIRM|nr:FAD-dependent oxidoreductase [Sulfobacillus harzensis]
MADRQRIVVVGGGYAGLAFIGQARRIPNVDITLIDPGDSHELIPELPEALRKHDPIEEHVVKYQDLLQGTGVKHIRDRVISIKMTQQQVILSQGQVEHYDWLLLSPGSVTAYPPIPGLEEHALPLRNAHDAHRIKERIREQEGQRIVVVGGGLTGVEVAGILAPDHDIWLVEGAKRLLPALGKGLAHYARVRLQRAGVKVMMGQKLTRVEAGTIQLERDALHYHVLIWAGGIQAPKWLRDTDLPLDHNGYPKVSPEGQISDRVFAAGDVWRVYVGDDEVPQTAQLAAMAGDYVGDAMARAIRGEPLPPPFRPRLRGMLISLDTGAGVGWVIRGGIPVRGTSARTLKSLSFQQYRLKLSRAFGRGWPF